MLVAGIDVGSLTAKAVLLKDGEIAAQAVIRATPRPEESAALALSEALRTSGQTESAIAYRVGTGYGRKRIESVDGTFSEIACHAKGICTLLPGTTALIDIGGQDAKAATLDEAGNVLRYSYNDKCASGTGRFLEIMAEVMEVALADMGELAQKAENTVRISNQCVVFAETEVISLINRGEDTGAIIRGLHEAMAGRVAALAKSIGVNGKAAFTGGVAKNVGVKAALEKALGLTLETLPIDPQINGAYGAALFAQEALEQKKTA